MDQVQLLKRFWDKKWIILAVAVIFALVCAVFVVHNAMYTSKISVSFVYPSAEKAQYPDGKRFMMYDLIDNVIIEGALEKMRSEGYYTNMSYDDIANNITIADRLSDTVQAKIDQSRSSGEKYTYFSTEYEITFKQPIVFSFNPADGLFGLLRKNTGDMFLNYMVEIYKEKFFNEHTETGDVYVQLANEMNFTGYDYHYLARLYSMRISLCQDYLYSKNIQNDTFVSPTTGRSFTDLITAYRTLNDINVSRLNSYVRASRLTNQLWQLINIYNTDIENLTLLYNKKQNEFLINENAMHEYDHTFTENLVIVTQNEENGLYQSRPRTDYDTITMQATDAGTIANATLNQIHLSQLQLSEYIEYMKETAEVNRMSAIADDMADEIKVIYNNLTQVSADTVKDYLRYANEDYIKVTDFRENSFGLGAFLNIGIFFLIGIFAGMLLVSLKKEKNAKEENYRL